MKYLALVLLFSASCDVYDSDLLPTTWIVGADKPDAGPGPAGEAAPEPVAGHAPEPEPEPEPAGMMAPVPAGTAAPVPVAGAAPIEDRDAGPPPPRCGDKHVDEGEICDGNCPACDDHNPCTADPSSGGVGTCDLTCLEHQPLRDGTQCMTSVGGVSSCFDGLCKTCGDGVVGVGETCDTSLAYPGRICQDCKSLVTDPWT